MLVGSGVCWSHENSHRPNTKTTVLSYCIGVFVGSIMVWWVKEMVCAYCNTITDSHSFYCNCTCMRMMGNTSNGGWENCVVGEHMHMENLFLNNFTKMVGFTSWMRFWNVQIPDSLRFIDPLKLYDVWSLTHQKIMMLVTVHHRYVSVTFGSWVCSCHHVWNW